MAFLLFLISAACAAAQAVSAPAVERKVVVEARQTRAMVTAWEKRCDDCEWEAAFRTEDGFVGRNGITAAKKEGDGATPAGTFEMRRAFGVGMPDKTALPYTQLAQSDIWVDDVNSRSYNQFVAGGLNLSDKDWNSYEELAQETEAYYYAVVIEYNTDPVAPGAGSAIFLHCSKGRPTAGCVSVPREFMERLLEFIRPGDKIIIKQAE